MCSGHHDFKSELYSQGLGNEGCVNLLFWWEAPPWRCSRRLLPARRDEGRRALLWSTFAPSDEVTQDFWGVGRTTLLPEFSLYSLACLNCHFRSVSCTPSSWLPLAQAHHIPACRSLCSAVLTARNAFPELCTEKSCHLCSPSPQERDCSLCPPLGHVVLLPELTPALNY